MLKLNMDFFKLYSQSSLKKLVDLDISNNVVGHLYLLSGQDQIYLKNLAKYFAKSLFCKQDLCNVCADCNKIENLNHADLLSYPIDGEGIKVEDVNKILEQIYIYPLEGDRKVLILNDFEKATVQAQNKLLKILEEPPKSAVIIITTTNVNAVLNTIKSRAKTVNVGLLNKSEIEDFLNGCGVDNSLVSIYANSAQGNLTKALKISKDADFIKLKEVAYNAVINLTSSGQILLHSSKITNYKDRVLEIFEEINLILLDIIYAKSGLTQFVVNIDKVNDYLSSTFTIKALKIISEKCLNSIIKINSNCNVFSVVDGFLLTMLEVKHKWK